MADLASLQVQLELQTAQFTEQMKTVNSQLDKLNNKVNAVSQTFGKLGAALLGAVSVGVVVAAFRNAINAMDDMRDAAQALGTTVEELSALSFAAAQSGVSFETLSTGLKNLNKNLADVEKGTSDAAKVMRAFGVTGADSTTEALKKMADGFAKLPTGPTKTAASLAAFGKAGQQMIPFLNEGAAGIEKLMERAKELGVVLDGDTTDKADAFNDAMGEIQAGSQGIVNKITEGLLPALQGIAEGFATASGAGDGWKNVGKGIGIVMNTLMAAGVALGGMFKNLANTLAGYAAASVAFLSGNFKQAGNILEALDEDTENLKTTTHQTIEALMNFDEEVAKAGDSTKKTAVDTKLLAATQKALETETKKTAKAVREYTQLALTPAQQVLIDLNKMGQERIKALDQLAEFMKLSPEMLKELGLTIEQVAEASEKLKKNAGVWTTLEQAMTNIAVQRKEVDALSAAWVSLIDALERGDVSPERFKEIADELGRMGDTMNGIDKGAESMSLSMQKLGEEITGAIATNASNAMNNLIDSFGEAEVSFSDMAASILKDIAKMITQLLIMEPLMKSIKSSGFFGLGAAGASAAPAAVFPAPVAVPMVGATAAFAATGLQAAPSSVMNGSPGNSSMQFGAGVEVNVYNSADVEVTTKESQGADGQVVIDMMIDKRINQRFSDGSMDKMLRANFGIMRNAGA